ncbi:cyclic nucleotide-binding domain-containing protein [Actinomadura barringtoniae]|uniref:Cyclic nucleotide-binding domain-containing protein n=1 Tax=Actinomadura barringtoniae TaxID=1427535 RepID=A0A939T7R1_9ACTN|nr:cyclic nucleotide-binding domain-containing protein [Actinomadura barringtoniae]MBO2449542.1 cyclic nucleotide-binding domain-containing protein [Actinomadura barringtoniae]
MGATFWSSLTDAEQQHLLGRGRRADHPPGTVLCREDDPATDVMVILQGSAKITSDDQTLALRGPGDLLGERAVLTIRSRSATVIALEPVDLLVVPAEDFARFLNEQPHLGALLEQELYDRLSEQRVPATLQRTSNEPDWSGQMCSILFTDIASFNDPSRTDGDRKVIKAAMYDVLQSSFGESGVPWTSCHVEDRGDGALLIAPPSIPTAKLVDPLVSRLSAGLRTHNRRATAPVRLQLRVALHVGPVSRDGRGVAGESVSQTARLLDAPILKAELAEAGSDLGFIVSEFVYDSVVKHAPGAVDPRAYRQVKVRVKETKAKAWIYLTADAAPNTPAVRAQNPPAAPGEPPPSTGPRFEGDLRVQGDFVLGNKIIIRE